MRHLCPHCVPTPNLGAVFQPSVDVVCSGRCVPCGPCLERSKYTWNGLARCFELGQCGQPPHVPDFFEVVVGVRVEDWIAATTLEQFHKLLAQRDGEESR